MLLFCFEIGACHHGFEVKHKRPLFKEKFFLCLKRKKSMHLLFTCTFSFNIPNHRGLSLHFQIKKRKHPQANLDFTQKLQNVIAFCSFITALMDENFSDCDQSHLNPLHEVQTVEQALRVVRNTHNIFSFTTLIPVFCNLRCVKSCRLLLQRFKVGALRISVIGCNLCNKSSREISTVLNIFLSAVFVTKGKGLGTTAAQPQSVTPS